MKDLFCEQHADSLHIRHGNDATDIPFILLRDMCVCEDCYVSATKERKRRIDQFDLDVRPMKIDVAGTRLTVIWSDNHCSEYDIESLKSISTFATDITESIPWQSNVDVPTYRYGELVSGAEILKSMIESFLQYGIVRIAESPVRKGFVEEFACQISCVREIVFDRVADIVSKKNAYTQGFTPVAIPLHTDCSGYRWVPSVFAFHCLDNSVEGGENLYSDGLNAALILQRQHPELFETLARQKIGFRLFSESHDTRHIGHTIELSDDNKIVAVRYANWAFHPISHDQKYLREYFSALKAFGEIIHAKSHVLKIRLAPGDLLLVNNQRVLHGRETFDSASGNRHFQQVYMEIDDLEARWRAL